MNVHAPGRHAVTRGCPAVPWAWLLVAAALAAACGSRGQPLPPLRIVPATITPVEVTRLGDRVYVEFTAPEQDSDGTIPGDIVRIEVYAVTTQPERERPRAPVDEDWFDAATLVAEFEVESPDSVPPPEDATESAPSPADETEDGPWPVQVVAQGDDVTVVEHLTPETLVPVVIGDPDDEDEEEDDEEEEDERPVPRPVVAPPFEPLPIRTYVAVAISSRERMGDPSPIADLPLTDPPAPPPGLPVVTYTEETVEVAWTEPATFRRRVQPDTPEPPLLLSRAVIEWPRGSEYAVYDHASWDLDAERPEPLASPGEEQIFEGSVAFGEIRCYVVRVIDYVGTTPIQGPASLASCVVPVDTFPPAAPTGLIAVADGNGISLVWDPNGEEDVAGYVVLRGGAPDATLQRLTAGPLVVTAFQDTRVTPGERYVYRVQAIDDSIPPNVSPLSEAVTETAR